MSFAEGGKKTEREQDIRVKVDVRVRFALGWVRVRVRKLVLGLEEVFVGLGSGRWLPSGSFGTGRRIPPLRSPVVSCD